MSTHSTVGKPITKKGKVVGYKDVQEIPTNQLFNYNRSGYATLQPDDIKALKKQPRVKEPIVASDEDLATLTVKELRVIAEPLGASGRLKHELIESIEQLRADVAAA